MTDEFKIQHLEDELEDVRKENIDRLMQKVKLEEEIQRLKSSPTTEETDELIERLRGIIGAEEITEKAAEALHRLARNQMSADYVSISQAAAMAVQRADELDRKYTQFTDALMRAMALMDELMRENGRLCALSADPPSVRLFAAKSSFDVAMRRLLGDLPEDLPQQPHQEGV